MDDDDSSSRGSSFKKYIPLLLVPYLGYTITGTYLIVLLANAVGEKSVALYNALGALLSMFTGYAIIKLTKHIRTVNRKIQIGALLYIMLEVSLYFLVAGKAEKFAALAVMFFDNLAMITLSAPLEVYIIKSSPRRSSAEVGAFATRLYILSGIVGSGIAYMLYPDIVSILLASIAFKLLAASLAGFYPPVENHDTITLTDFIDPDVSIAVIVEIAAEVAYIMLPIAVAAKIGEHNYAVYAIATQAATFLLVGRLSRAKYLYEITAFYAVLFFIQPVLFGIAFFAFTRALFYRRRNDIIGDWGVDDSVTGMYGQNIVAAILSPLVISLASGNLAVLSALLLLSAILMKATQPTQE